jgi:NAD(P)-dependent dehydrogenase (short-subunit alcohol dehydrogenase family)
MERRLRVSQPARITTPFDKSTTAAEIIDDSPGAAVSVRPLELTDRTSVAAFVGAWQGPLQVLVGNAGVSGLPEKRTPEGWEYNFAANYLGHFALACGLHGALAAAGDARVVAAASPLLDGVGGRYFENCNEALPRDQDRPPTDLDEVGVARYAIDPDVATRLWDVSMVMLRDAGWIG